VFVLNISRLFYLNGILHLTLEHYLRVHISDKVNKHIDFKLACIVHAWRVSNNGFPLLLFNVMRYGKWYSRFNWDVWKPSQE